MGSSATSKYVAADQSRAEAGISLSPALQGMGLAAAALRDAVRWLFRCTPVPLAIGIVDARNAAAAGYAVGRVSRRALP